AYAVIFTASDLQGGDAAYTNFASLLNVAKTDAYADPPDGILLGGDYNDGSETVEANVSAILGSVQSVYPDYSVDDMILVQGNHDSAPYHATGAHEFEHYNVYVMNINDYPRAQAADTANEQKIKDLAANLETYLEQLKNTGDTRPVFITTHTPMHHSVRGDSNAGDYGDTLYSKYVFDVVNEYGQYLDIIFLFGHNHSSNYDDYIGGAVNYIAKGETMRVPIPDKAQQGANGYTDETLNFTYMNYGYVGYTNNTESETSTNTLTIGAIELCTTTIELTRYSQSGVYTTETIQRVNPLTTDPYVKVNGETTGTEGNSSIVYGVSANIENPTYSWSTSDDSVVKVLPAGKNAQVIYTGEGTADVTLTVTGADGKSYSEKITITVEPCSRLETVPGETYTVYKLVSSITPGKNYVIASRNTAGSSTAITATLSSSRYLAQTSVTVEDGSTDTNVGANYIESPDSSIIIWTAGGSSGAYTFMNGSNYMSTNGSNRFRLNTTATTWSYTNNRLKVASANYYVTYGSSRYSLGTSGSNVYFYEETTITTPGKEEIVTDPYEPNVIFEKNSQDINGEILKLYNVKFGTSFMIDGSFTGFVDKVDNVTTTWTTSNSDVATVENGYVTMVGNGETTITYTVTDGTTTIEKTVTLVLSDEDKPVQYFALTDNFVNGNLYVIALADGSSATIMSPPFTDTYSGDATYGYRFSAATGTIDTTNNSLTVEDDSLIWKAVATEDGSGFYLKNVQYGYYLYANNDTRLDGTTGTLELAATEDKSLNGTVWSVDDSTGYIVSNDNLGIKLSGNGNFRASTATDTSSRTSIYGLTKVSGTVGIRSRYQDVHGTTMTRENVCPFQTETLLAKPNNFSVEDEFITYEWTSSNPDVATIDNNGVVTYTGNPGTAEFTVVATSTVADEAGEYETATASVSVNVVAQSIDSVSESFVLTTELKEGNLYVLASTNVVGSTTLMVPPYTDTYSGDTRYGYRYSGASATVDSDNSINVENDAYVWEAIAADDGSGFYLRNVGNGYYLYANDDSRTTSAGVATLELGGTDDKTLNGTIWTADSNGQIISNDNLRIYLSGNGNFRAHASSSKQYLYGKTTGSSEVPAPVTQIRVSSLLGTDDISNQLQNRYNIKANDTERVLRYTENFASITNTKWSVSDESIATIDENGLLTYTGKEGFVSVTLVVTGTDATGQVVEHTVRTTFNVSNDDYEAPTEDYPQYPHEGSVRVNKTASNTAGGYNFQTSGVTEVELSVTGVPLTQAVDVVVVLDHSSSMSNNGVTRLENAIANTRDFAMQVVTSNPNNRIAVVTFDRPRATYGSEGSGVNNFTDTTPDDTTYTANPEDRIVTGDGTAENAFMALEDSEQLIAQIDSISTNNIGGTNYDFGLQEAYRILKAAKSDPNANKMQYVVFMSDGEPYTYNRIRVEYNGNYDGVYDAWLTGDETNATLAGHLADTETYPAAQYFNTDGENWFAVALKTPEGQDVAGLPNVDYYDGFHEGLGATLFTIGYDAGEPGTITRDILTNMASTEDDYYYAEGNLQAAYDSILEKIVYAANNAVVTDKMGENFQLQFAPSLTLDNGMATLTFDPAPYIEIGSWTLNSDGTRNEYTAVETITFETDASGKLTAAYSNLRGSNNIYDSATNKIVGSKVTYDITSETFSWNVGDITRDEVTLKYYAYLEGSAEGEREAGTFDTNEYAYLDYTNYRGTQCHQVFPVPSLAWKDAIVGYEFYLVNGNGEPVNKDGVVVPFAERVLVGQEKTKSLILNSAGDYSALTLVAKEEVPAGYILFNENTSYSVSVSSGDNPSQAIINDSADIKTTYFRDGTTVYKGDGVVPNVTDYMNTRVSFAILRVGGIVPDSVVIDYGLSVKISVLANDINANKGVLNAIGTQLLDGTELNNVPYSESRLQDATKTGLVLPNGTASINGSQVVFTPSNLTMSTENVFYYEYLTDDGLYMYAEITVIPAANIYYEESFFTFNDGDGYTWQTAGAGFDDKFQAEDRPGTFSFADVDANNVYGMDNAYDDSYTYSLGSAKFTSVDENAYGKEPTAEFTFCGTGFDLFSVTNSNTGAVLVTVYDSDGALCENFIVQTYYGYTYDEENDKFVPSTDSTGVLYQVPVISAHNLGYDTYRVVIKPIYSTLFDKAADGSYDFYLDSVRIYNPAGQKPAEDSVIGDAYIEDSEYNPNFKELRNTILDANTFYSDIYELDGTKYGKGSVFIDSIGALDETGISDKFLTAGPNNEVYLAEGQAIAFHLVSDTELSPSSVQLGMKTVFGESSEVALMNTNDLSPRYVTVSGAHEMYRRLASAIVWDETELATTGKYKTKYPIVIINTSDSILSLTQLKWAFAVPTDDAELQVVVDSETPARAYSVAKSVMAPFPYTDEDIKMEWSDTSLKVGAEVTLTITTPADIAKITIDGIEITEFTVDENGNKVWTYTFMVQETGENTYDILLFANNGKVSQPMVTETITVNEDNGAVNPFEAILELIKRILQFFREIFA
ncbi:MAG: VWA domain-containing protein, partial [Clostridia bacterium]|nr:VWA domain-containing protein [Clostridia bacterium]